MATFRKRPMVVEAEQWLGPESKIDGVYLATPWKTNRVHERQGRPGQKVDHFYVDTLEGFLEVSPGDWIVRGVKGEIYPVKPDIFEATYEPVDFPPLPR